jgi:hypothetical protein
MPPQPPVSLREALEAAHATSAADTIEFAAAVSEGLILLQQESCVERTIQETNG